ncbi:hypothetical protein B0T19DRAFT_409165 [Cercophora scortea]|uniref:Uncharacterized protein n=1 Tax=Cercophora scortea TaxID=314031 RepID=A0AAE0J3M9_9PEZI|nr:hypothetical protein B0T19DRAFT_409165 [Cercophora scortea]
MFIGPCSPCSVLSFLHTSISAPILPSSLTPPLSIALFRFLYPVWVTLWRFVLCACSVHWVWSPMISQLLHARRLHPRLLCFCCLPTVAKGNPRRHSPGTYCVWMSPRDTIIIYPVHPSFSQHLIIALFEQSRTGFQTSPSGTPATRHSLVDKLAPRRIAIPSSMFITR